MQRNTALIQFCDQMFTQTEDRRICILPGAFNVHDYCISCDLSHADRSHLSDSAPRRTCLKERICPFSHVLSMPILSAESPAMV